MKKSRGVTSAVAIGTLIVGLLIGVGVGTYALAPSLIGQSTVTTTQQVGKVTTTLTTTVNTGGGGPSGICSGGTYTIGLLTDLTGDLKAQGINTQTAVGMAIGGLNNYTKSIGCNATFTSKTADYASDPAKAPAAAQALNNAGVKVAVGPLDSASIEAILGYANTNHIVMISPSSTAYGFALPNDYLFRTVPSDFWQGKADSAELQDRGIKDIVVINRIGIYADGLANSTIVNFKALGGSVSDHIRYDAKTTTDFTSQISKLGSDWTSASATYGANHVAVYVVAFEEIDQLFLQAKSQQPSIVAGPNGNGPIWFGSDGTAQDSVISGNATAGPIVAQVELPSTIYSTPNNTKTIQFFSAFYAKTHQTPTIYQTGAYDDTWIAGLSILAAGKYDGAAIQQAIIPTANNYYGVLGSTAMDQNGDVLPLFGYAIYKVAVVSGSSTWVLAGTWDVNTGKVTWVSGQAP
jgi:branched-chain amino acid transport system substrate-binding protein